MLEMQASDPTPDPRHQKAGMRPEDCISNMVPGGFQESVPYKLSVVILMNIQVRGAKWVAMQKAYIPPCQAKAVPDADDSSL